MSCRARGYITPKSCHRSHDPAGSNSEAACSALKHVHHVHPEPTAHDELAAVMTTAEWIIVVHTVHAIAKHAVKGVAQACGDPDDATVIGQLCDANTPLIYTEDADKTLVDIKDVILLGMANALEGCATGCVLCAAAM